MDFVGLKVALVKKVEMHCYIEAHRVADVGVDVVLDVFEHFIKVSGACSTQEACVAISLTNTERQTRGCSCCGIIAVIVIIIVIDITSHIVAISQSHDLPRR